MMHFSALLTWLSSVLLLPVMAGKDRAYLWEKENQLRPLEFVNGPRERKLSAIETEFAKLKPAAEAFKAAQPK